MARQTRSYGFIGNGVPEIKAKTTCKTSALAMIAAGGTIKTSRSRTKRETETLAPPTGFSISERASRLHMLERPTRIHELVADRLDAAYYVAQLGPGDPPADPVAHYLLVGERLGLEPTPTFSPEYYRAKHPGITAPFEHYVTVGESLGLRGKPDLEGVISPGCRPLRGDREPLLVCGSVATFETLGHAHDLIACIATDFEPGHDAFDAVALVARIDATLDACEITFILRELKRQYAVRAIVLDTTMPVLAWAALHAHLPSIALFHNDRNQMRPGSYAEIIDFVDVAIVTSERLARAIAIDVYEARGGAARTIVVQTELDRKSGYISIEHAIDRATESRGALLERAAAVVESCDFDAAYHEGAIAPLAPSGIWAAALSYASRAAKGLACCNPRPGLHEGVRALRGMPLGTSARSEDTHRCIRMSEITAEASVQLRVALHVHLYYSELAADFRAAIDAVDFPMDVIATTSAEEDSRTIERAFDGYARGSLTILLVPNRGRDIAAIVAVEKHLRNRNYDVVGHLHGKRSLEADSSGRTGDAWRRFHLATLLGDAEYYARLMSLFTHEPELGLVFPEDRHVVGWQLNEPIAAALVARLTPPPTLPRFPIMPVGTAFWARPAALAPLWDLHLTPEDFPPEPLAYDGTIPHAIECLIPTLCESAGYAWCTVYRAGFAW